MADVDSLSSIIPDVWPSLIEIFTRPEDYMARVTIRTQTINLNNFPDFPVKSYAPYNDPKLGLIFIWSLNGISYEISVFSNTGDKTELIKALKNTKQIDWNSKLLFCSMLPDVQTALVEVLDFKEFTYDIDLTFVARYPKEKALELESVLPSDVKLEIIGPQYAEEVNNTWPHRYPGSLCYFEGMLGRRSALAVVGIPDGELRGWILRSVRGDLHALYVKDEFRRKGYAQLLINTLSKKIAVEDIDVFGCVITNNKPSKDLFMRLGFDLSITVSWMMCHPKVLAKTALL